MKINIKNNILVICIVLIAAILRFHNLSINPPHLTPDEAALGYNAYSILKTARDEYGEFLPIVFKSFGDYKPGFYVYASVLPVALFGLSEFAVRFASAFSGVIAVYLVYQIVLLLEAKSSKLKIHTKSLALTSALILAVSPWHIHFSRGAWEVNLALTLVMFGIYFFLKSLEKNYLLVASAIFFGLSLITYQGAKLSAGIVLLVLLGLYTKDLLGYKKKAIVSSFFVGLIIAIPIVASFFLGQTGRLKVFSIFSQRRPQEYLAQQLDQAQIKEGSIKYYLFYSEGLNTFKGIAGRWFNHFTPRFLVFEGDWQNPRHSSPDHGEMLLASWPFLIIGLFVLARNWNTNVAKFILIWLVLAPLPAALSRDEIHAVRAFNMVIPLTLSVSVGIVASVEYVSSRYHKSLLRYLYYLFVISVFALSTVYYLDSYFVHQSIHNWRYWDYGYKQVVEAVTPIQKNYDRVNVHFTYAQPYIYFLFYQKYDPKKYQEQAYLEENSSGDVGRVINIDNVSIEYLNWTQRRGDFGELFVADNETRPISDSSDPREFKQIGEVLSPEGSLLFRLVEVLDEENVNRNMNFD